MLRTLLMVSAGVLMAGPGSPVRAQEGGEADEVRCDKCVFIEAGEQDFCDTHGKGRIFGAKVTSKKLFEALAPIKHTREALQKCPGCRKAADTKSKCDTCGKNLVGLREYRSPVAHKLAKGREVRHEAAFQCDECKKAWAQDGSCSACKLHFAGKRMFKNSDEHKAALAAHDTLTKAVETKCEGCSVAMVTDGKCDHCNASFKDGKPVKS